jgi:hypothetical protein
MPQMHKFINKSQQNIIFSIQLQSKNKCKNNS